MNLIPQLLIIATVLIGGIITWLFSRRNYIRFPELPYCTAPRSLILGNMKLFFDVNKGWKRLFVDDAKDVGIIQVSAILNEPVIAILKSSYVQQVLQSFTFRETPRVARKYFAGVTGARTILELNGDEWLSLRKLMNRAFHFENLRNMTAPMHRVAVAVTKQLEQRVGTTVDMWPVMKCITMQVIGETAFGYDFDSIKSLEMSPVAEAFEFILADATRRIFSFYKPSNYFYWWPNAANRKYRASHELCRGAIDNLVARREAEKARGENVEHKDLLEHMINASKEHGILVDSATLADNLMTFLFAGFDTSSIALTYTMYLLAQHPEVDSKALDEIRRVLGDDPDTLPTYDNLQNDFPYCMAVITEAMRLYPPVPNNARQLTKDLEIEVQGKKVTLPKGQRIFIPNWWIHRSEINYGPTALDFDPERFLADGADKALRFANVPFSGGPRDCIGRRFAMLEMMAVFVTMLRKVKFLPSPGYVLEVERVAPVQRPKHGMPLIIAARK